MKIKNIGYSALIPNCAVNISKHRDKKMRAITSLFGVLLLLVSWNGPARADLLVASYYTSELLRYDTRTGAFLGSFATTGTPDYRPLSMTVGPGGNLYIPIVNFVPPYEDSIGRFDGQTGAFIDTFASGGGLFGPGHLVFGPDGNLYVSSFGGTAEHSKIIRYNGITGAYMSDFVPVGSGGLSGAEGLVFGPDGNLYITSRVTDQVLRYDGSTGAFLGVFATGGQNGPIDLLFGPDGNLYVLNTTGARLEVLRFDGLTGAFIDVFVPLFSGGSDGSSLAFGPDRNLYVTTAWVGNSVRCFDGSTGQFIDEFVPPGSGGLNYAAGLLFYTPIFQLVTIDIKPHDLPNGVNPKSKGKIPVAILTTDSFDATTVDPTTVFFGRTGTEAAALRSALEDVDGDGDTDMILYFNTEDAGIACGDTSASVTGKTFAGKMIKGSDSIKTVDCK